jgi:hypothetical protein
MPDEELVPLEKAAEQLKVTRATMWRRVREWGLTVYGNPLVKRQRLLKWSEIEEALKPTLLARPKKEAA